MIDKAICVNMLNSLNKNADLKSQIEIYITHMYVIQN